MKLHQQFDASDIMTGSKVVAVKDIPGKNVVACLEDGREVEGSMLIAADGINSLVRGQLFPDVHPEPCGYEY